MLGYMIKSLEINRAINNRDNFKRQDVPTKKTYFKFKKAPADLLKKIRSQQLAESKSRSIKKGILLFVIVLVAATSMVILMV